MPPNPNIEDLRVIAQRRLPHPLFGNMERGPYEQTTLAANPNDLMALNLRQRG